MYQCDVAKKAYQNPRLKYSAGDNKTSYDSASTNYSSGEKQFYSDSSIDNKLGNPPDQIKEDYNLAGKLNYLPGQAGESAEKKSGEAYSDWCEAKDAGPQYL